MKEPENEHFIKKDGPTTFLSSFFQAIDILMPTVPRVLFTYTVNNLISPAVPGPASGQLVFFFSKTKHTQRL